MQLAGNGVWLWIGLLSGLGAFTLIAVDYRRVLQVKDYGPGIPWLIFGLRLLALALFVMLVINPILRVDRTPRDKQRVAILVDTSRSMGINDSVGGETRIATAQRILYEQRLFKQLSSLAKTTVQGFDITSRTLEADDVKAEGDGSDLARAVSKVYESQDTVPLNAIVLITDGCETSAKSVADLPRNGVPIYPIGLGSSQEALSEICDVAVTNVKADREVMVNSKVEVKVELAETHLAGENVTLQIFQGAQQVAEQVVTLAEGHTEATLSFNPATPGLFDCEARAVPLEKEKIKDNNSRYFPMKVSAQKIRVFYYEGTPRWTYKFLTRELKRDAQVALQAVLRTNADRAYQTATAAPQTAVFPARREDLKRYDCIILGDLRAHDLTQAQAQALTQYVSEDGGGLILLAGKDSFSPDGLSALGLDKLSPAPSGDVREIADNFEVLVTPEGYTHPIFSGQTHFLPLENIFALGALKPGAQVLARVHSGKGDFPLAAALRLGAGRVFLFASDNDWKWLMKYKDQGGEGLYTKLWGQAVRWAANRNPENSGHPQAEVTTDKEIYKPEETVKIRVTGAPAGEVKEARVSGEAVPLQQNLEQLEGTYLPPHPGIYSVSAGGASCEFLVERTPSEFDRIALNEALLHKVANTTGGQYFDAVSAQKLPEALKSAGTVKVETVEYVFAESWIPFLVALAALAGEWVLRKKMQVI